MMGERGNSVTARTLPLVIVWLVMVIGIDIGASVSTTTTPNSEDIGVYNTRTEKTIRGSKIEPPSRPNSYWDDPHFKPYFDNSTNYNVTTQVGKTAYLQCQIRQLGDRTVSWVRQKDLHIMTVGKYSYISDPRFSSIHQDDSDVWTLEIRDIHKKDAGVYECQISTESKLSLNITLHVMVPKALLPGSPSLYIQSGSSLNLSCIITDSNPPPSYVLWYHNGKMVTYDGSRVGGLKNGHSFLLIKNARPIDSGNYSCMAPYADPANITVHVLNGEKPAAMQHGSHSNSVTLHQGVWIVISLCTYFLSVIAR